MREEFLSEYKNIMWDYFFKRWNGRGREQVRILKSFYPNIRILCETISLRDGRRGREQVRILKSFYPDIRILCETISLRDGMGGGGGGNRFESWRVFIRILDGVPLLQTGKQHKYFFSLFRMTDIWLSTKKENLRWDC